MVEIINLHCGPHNNFLKIVTFLSDSTIYSILKAFKDNSQKQVVNSQL